MTAIASRTIRFHETGEPLAVLHEETVEVADPSAGLVRVRVIATGLNPADWEICRGFMPGALPRGIGCDVAGTVDAIGEGVDDVAVGDVVFGTVDFAGQPSAGAADVALLNGWWRVPRGLDPVDASVLPMVVTTARWTLDLLRVPAGATIVIHGAGGMVGYAAVQIAIGMGARVIATAGPTFTADLEGFGALVTPYGPGVADRVRQLAQGDADLVLDVSRPAEGTIAPLIEIAGDDPSRVMTISNHDEARRLGARVNLDEFMAAGALPSADFLDEYATLMAAGEFRIPIANRYPLEAWRDAVELSVSGTPRGKLVLLP